MGSTQRKCGLQSFTSPPAPWLCCLVRRPSWRFCSTAMTRAARHYLPGQCEVNFGHRRCPWSARWTSSTGSQSGACASNLQTAATRTSQPPAFAAAFACSSWRSRLPAWGANRRCARDVGSVPGRSVLPVNTAALCAGTYSPRSRFPGACSKCWTTSSDPKGSRSAATRVHLAHGQMPSGAVRPRSTLSRNCASTCRSRAPSGRRALSFGGY